MSLLPSAAAVIARQLIFDRQRDIFGYELCDQGAARSPERDAEVLAHAATLADHQVVASRRVLMVGCSAQILTSGRLDVIDPEGVVLDVALPTDASPEEVQALAGELGTLHQRGFRFALAHDVLGSAWPGWLAHAQFLKLDMRRIPAPAFGRIVAAASANPALTLVAVGIDTAEQHAQAMKLGIGLFQGPFFAQPVLVKGQPVRPSQAVVLDLIMLLRRQADVSEIETLLKRDAALSVNLLRFINSPGFGLSTEITSFRHAVMILGSQKLLRWACLLMASSKDGVPAAVGQTAVARGRLMELLAGELLTAEECDHAFVVGVFSMLDAMTRVPLPVALERLPLPESVLDALLRRDGVFAPFLELTEACEASNEEVFARAATRLKLTSHQVNMAHLQALAWAEELLAA